MFIGKIFCKIGCKIHFLCLKKGIYALKKVNLCFFFEKSRFMLFFQKVEFMLKIMLSIWLRPLDCTASMAHRAHLTASARQSCAVYALHTAAPDARLAS